MVSGGRTRARTWQLLIKSPKLCNKNSHLVASKHPIYYSKQQPNSFSLRTNLITPSALAIGRRGRTMRRGRPRARDPGVVAADRRARRRPDHAAQPRRPADPQGETRLAAAGGDPQRSRASAVEGLMADLLLAKLPDRTPVKITLAVTPDLHQALANCAEPYRETTASRDRFRSSFRRCWRASWQATRRSLAAVAVRTPDLAERRLTWARP